MSDTENNEIGCLLTTEGFNSIVIAPQKTWVIGPKTIETVTDIVAVLCAMNLTITGQENYDDLPNVHRYFCDVHCYFKEKGNE